MVPSWLTLWSLVLLPLGPWLLVQLPRYLWSIYPLVPGQTTLESLVLLHLGPWSDCPSVPLFLKPDKKKFLPTRARRHVSRESRAKIDVCGLRCKAEVPRFLRGEPTAPNDRRCVSTRQFFRAQCPPSGSLIHPPHVCLSVIQGWTRPFSPFGGKLQRKKSPRRNFEVTTWTSSVFQRPHRNIGLSPPEWATNQRQNFTKADSRRLQSQINRLLLRSTEITPEPLRTTKNHLELPQNHPETPRTTPEPLKTTQITAELPRTTQGPPRPVAGKLFDWWAIMYSEIWKGEGGVPSTTVLATKTNDTTGTTGAPTVAH